MTDITVLQVSASIAQIVGIAPDLVTSQSRLIDDLGLDSLARYELVIGLQHDYGVEVPVTLSPGWDRMTVDDLVREVNALPRQRPL